VIFIYLEKLMKNRTEKNPARQRTFQLMEAECSYVCWCDRVTVTTTSSLWHNIHLTTPFQTSGTWSGIRIPLA